MIFSQEPPLEAQIETWLNMAGFFSLGKKLILDCQSPTNSRTKYRTKLPNHEKSIGIFGFKSCRMKILGSVPKKYQKTHI